MINKFFKIKLNSDCILKSISATEGVPESLSFIPGSLMLGITAQHYNKFQNPFDIFHSGKVKFGNAFVYICGKPCLKAPLSWHYPKDEEKTKKIVGSHLVEGYDDLEKRLNDKQPKQMREDYIDIEFNNLYTPDYNFQLKSAFDARLGRSKDASMFAYETLKKGTEYFFEVAFDSSIPKSGVELVEKILAGRHFIGKSKTAQFGSIDIMPYDLKIIGKSFSSISDAVFSVSENLLDKELSCCNDDLIFLYAKSDMVLNNECGFNKVDLDSPVVLGINSGRISHKKTYADYRKFNMFNFAVKRRLPIRTVINAGSVICIEGVDKTEKETLISKKVIYAGNYLSEGFGEIYVNPPFLFKKEYTGLNKAVCGYDSENKNVRLCDAFINEDKIVQEINNNEKKVLKYLNSKINEKFIVNKSLELAEEIHNAHKRKFDKITKSQWGAIRGIAKQYGKDKNLLIDKINEYTGHGVAHDIWEDKNGREILIKTLEEYKDKQCDFTIAIEYLAKLFSSDIKGKNRGNY
jgi:hypothetical protein